MMYVLVRLGYPCVCLQIQCAWRCYWARRRLRLLRKIRAVRVKQENRARYEARKLERFRQAGAALTLQKFWRKLQAQQRNQVRGQAIEWAHRHITA